VLGLRSRHRWKSLHAGVPRWGSFTALTQTPWLYLRGGGYTSKRRERSEEEKRGMKREEIEMKGEGESE